MKKVLIFHLLILLFACSQSNNSETTNDTTQIKPEIEQEPSEEDIIADIKKQFTEINQSTNSYDVNVVEILGESTEGGELKSYTQNGELKKMVVSYFGEMGKLVEEYYFFKEQLFFAFIQRYSYDKPIYVEHSKVEKIEEERYYFHKDKLVRWLNPDKEQVASSNFKPKELAILRDVKGLKERLEITDESGYGVDMRSLLSLCPISIFENTVSGMTDAGKKNLVKNGQSDFWKITEETNTTIILEGEENDPVKLYFLEYEDSSDGLLAVEMTSGKVFSIQLWKYSNSEKRLEKSENLKQYSANIFVSPKDKLPDSYEPTLHYQFTDDQTIEVSLYTWMDELFENREVINKVVLKWNGKDFEERIEKI
jgi:hypothetical protein